MTNENYQKQGYLLEDFRLFHLRGAAGIKTEYHYHEFCKLLLLRSGDGSYWIEGRQYALQPGDIILVGDGCPHRPEFAPGSPYERIILYISPEFLRENSTPDCDLTEYFRGGRVLRPQGTATRQLWSMVESLEQELSSDAYGRVILSASLLLRLVVEVTRQLRRGDSLQPGAGAPKSGRIREIMAYVDAHLTEELSVEGLAEAFYLSKYHMMRCFRAETGSSINQYITQQRLMLARELIHQGLSATESCFRSGFGSYSSFTRTYGKYFGTTPTGRKCAAAQPIGEEE